MARMRAVESVDARGMSLDALMENLDLRDPIKVPVAFLDNETNEWRQMADAAIFLDAETRRPVSKVVSANYANHGWRPLLELIERYGLESGLELHRIYHGPSTLVAEYELPISRAREVGTVIGAGVRLSTGIEMLTSLAAALRRLVCSNGMVAREDGVSFSISHATKLSEEVLSQAGSAVERLISTTGAHSAWIDRLAQVDIDPVMSRALLRILAYPGTAIRQQAQLPARAPITWQALEPVARQIASDEQKAIRWNDDANTPFAPSNSYRAMLDSWQTAPGHDTATLAGVYHAITHHWSHGVSGTSTSRRYSVLADSAASRLQLAGDIIDSYRVAQGVVANA